jgi:hypothetical protein
MRIRKRIIVGAIAVGLFLAPGASAKLYDYFLESQGSFPSVADRALDAHLCGIEFYTGTALQNIALEACLKRGPAEVTLGGTPTTTVGRMYIESPDFQLFTGAAAADTTLVLNDLEDIYGNNITMEDVGSVGYARINPEGASVSESIAFTGITRNANGTATLTGVSTVLAQYPYTETSGLTRSHAIGSLFRLTNTAAFYNNFANKANSEIIDVVWHFGVTPTSTDTCTETDEFCNKAYIDAGVNQGAATSTESNGGIVELSTQIEMASSTDLGVNQPLVLQAKYSTSTPDVRGLYNIVSENDGFLNQSWLDLTESWTFVTNSLKYGAGVVTSTSQIYGIPQALETGQINDNWLKNPLPTVSSTGQVLTIDLKGNPFYEFPNYIGSSVSSTHFTYVVPADPDTWGSPANASGSGNTGYYRLESSGSAWRNQAGILMGVDDLDLQFNTAGVTTTIEFRHIAQDGVQGDRRFGLGSNAIFDNAYNNTDGSGALFGIDGETLYSVSWEGAATTNVIAGVSTTQWSMYKIELVHGVEAKFWVDGVLKQRHTTNLPSSATGVYVGFGGETSGEDSAISLVTVNQQLN